MTAARPITSILVATDLSEGSVEAVRAAADLAIVTGARLHVIHGHEEPSMLSSGRDLLSVQRQVHEKRADLLDMIQGVSDRRIEVASARVHIGSPAEVILTEARSVGADVIVLGSHRHRGAADRLIGGTAEHVLRRATVPCLVLNGPLSLPIERVLVPSDLRSDVQRVAGTALSWADLLSRGNQVEVTLAHVVELPGDADGPSRATPELRQQLSSLADKVSRGNGWKRPLRTRLIEGEDPASEIGAFADAADADLVILGTQADPMIVRALLGSVSSAIVRNLQRPILLIPPAARSKVVSRVYDSPPDMLAQPVAV